MTEFCEQASIMVNESGIMVPRVRPFLGSVRSSAFHVQDESGFEADPAISSLTHDLDVLRGQRAEDSKPMFCLVRDMEPGAPFVIWRAAGLGLLQDQGSKLADIDDAHGWIAALRRHIDPDCAIAVLEYLSPDAPGQDLFWVILPEAAVCSLRPAETGCGGLDGMVGGGMQ